MSKELSVNLLQENGISIARTTKGEDYIVLVLTEAFSKAYIAFLPYPDEVCNLLLDLIETRNKYNEQGSQSVRA